MAADIFEIEVARVDSDEGPAYGAAILAAVGAGMHETVEKTCSDYIRVKDVKHPDTAQREKYRHLYGLYQPLYSELKRFFERDAAFIHRYS
jgi:xylulokinase